MLQGPLGSLDFSDHPNLFHLGIVAAGVVPSIVFKEVLAFVSSGLDTNLMSPH